MSRDGVEVEVAELRLTQDLRLSRQADLWVDVALPGRPAGEVSRTNRVAHTSGPLNFQYRQRLPVPGNSGPHRDAVFTLRRASASSAGDVLATGRLDLQEVVLEQAKQFLAEARRAEAAAAAEVSPEGQMAEHARALRLYEVAHVPSHRNPHPHPHPLTLTLTLALTLARARALARDRALALA